MLAPGGALLFFSCSQAFGRDLLLETLSSAARDVKKTCRIVTEIHQPPDHPVSLNFPESDYLKGFLMEVRI
jgi:23S rRNA (cytosine1962-C5)-methyltransferase